MQSVGGGRSVRPRGQHSMCYLVTVSPAVTVWVSVKPVWLSAPLMVTVQVPRKPLTVFTVTVALFVPPFGVTEVGDTVHV